MVPEFPLSWLAKLCPGGRAVTYGKVLGGKTCSEMLEPPPECQSCIPRELAQRWSSALQAPAGTWHRLGDRTGRAWIPQSLCPAAFYCKHPGTSSLRELIKLHLTIIRFLCPISLPGKLFQNLWSDGGNLISSFDAFMASSSSFVLEPALSSHFNSSPPSWCLPCCIYTWQSCSPSVFILPDKSSQAFFQSLLIGSPSPSHLFSSCLCSSLCSTGTTTQPQAHWGGFNAGACLSAASVVHLQDLSSGQMSVWQRGNEEVSSFPLLKPGPAPIPCRQIHVTNCAQCSAGPFSSC